MVTDRTVFQASEGCILKSYITRSKLMFDCSQTWPTVWGMF